MDTDNLFGTVTHILLLWILPAIVMFVVAYLLAALIQIARKKKEPFKPRRENLLLALILSAIGVLVILGI